MKNFYEIIYLSSNTPWSGQDSEPEGFQLVEQSVKQAIQMAHSFIWNSYDFSFRRRKVTIPTIATVKAYAKPIGQVVNVWLDGSSGYLTYLKDYDFLDNTVGTPTSWYINDNNEVCLYPIPNSVMNLNMRYQTLDMAKTMAGVEKYNLEDGTDVLNIPQELEDTYLQALMALSVVNFIQDNTDENYAPYQSAYGTAYQNLMREVRGSAGNTRIVI